MNRTVLTIGTLAGIAGVYYAALGRGHLAEIHALEREFGDSYSRYEQSDQQAQRTAELKACVRELEQWRDELAARTKAGASTAPLPATATALSGEGLTIDRAELLPADATVPIPHDRMRVVVTGTFADVFRAIGKLENGAPPARVTDLLLRGRPDSAALTGDLTIVRTGGALR